MTALNEKLDAWRRRIDNPGATWSHERVAAELKAAISFVDELRCALQSARDTALEEAARVLDENADELVRAKATTDAEAKIQAATLTYTRELAEEIRTLKATPPEDK